MNSLSQDERQGEFHSQISQQYVEKQVHVFPVLHNTQGNQQDYFHDEIVKLKLIVHFIGLFVEQTELTCLVYHQNELQVNQGYLRVSPDLRDIICYPRARFTLVIRTFIAFNTNITL